MTQEIIEDYNDAASNTYGGNAMDYLPQGNVMSFGNASLAAAVVPNLNVMQAAMNAPAPRAPGKNFS